MMAGVETFFYLFWLDLLMKGTYVLLMKLDKDSRIQIGKCGEKDFKDGWYCYIGSGFNGLESRIERHRKLEKKFFWHIDYFLKMARIHQVFVKQGDVKEECNIARAFSKKFYGIPNFGCSDCDCRSHLYYGEKEKLLVLIRGYGFTPYYI